MWRQTAERFMTDERHRTELGILVLTLAERLIDVSSWTDRLNGH